MRAVRYHVAVLTALVSLGTSLLALDRLDVTGAGFTATTGSTGNTFQMSGSCTPGSATKYANGTISSGTTWVNPTNVVSSNDVYTTRATARRVTETTNWQMSGFSAEIPAGAANITSLSVDWEIKFSASGTTTHGTGLTTSGGTSLLTVPSQNANPTSDTVYSNTSGSATVAQMRAATLLIVTSLYRDDSAAQTASLDMLRVNVAWC